MSLPDSVLQLFALLLLVVPGIAFAAARQWFRGQEPDGQDFNVRVVRAITVSVALDAVYVLVGGDRLVSTFARLLRSPSTATSGTRAPALEALLLLVVVPAALGRLLASYTRPTAADREHLRATRHRRARLTAGYYLAPATRIDPTPTAWDWAAARNGDCFVRILTSDGYWVGGELTDVSYASTYPQPRDVFIAIEWAMDADGSFREAVSGSLGVYVPLGDGDRVTWLARPEGDATRPGS